MCLTHYSRNAKWSDTCPMFFVVDVTRGAIVSLSVTHNIDVALLIAKKVDQPSPTSSRRNHREIIQQRNRFYKDAAERIIIHYSNHV